MSKVTLPDIASGYNLSAINSNFQKIEDELKDFEGAEQQEMRDELGAHDSGVDGLIKAGYDLLGLETYLTTGPEETRAWTIKKGSTAPRAAAPSSECALAYRSVPLACPYPCCAGFPGATGW